MAKGKAYLKRVRQDTLAVVDKDGELKNVQKPVYVKVKGNTNYAQWMDNLSPVIKSLEHVSDIKLLYWIGQHLEYDGGIISLNKVYKKRCSNEMNISISAIDKSIRVLKRVDLLVDHEDSRKSAIFRVNPAYLWRGSSAEHNKNESQWLERKRVTNLPDKEKDQEKLIKSERPKYDFSKIKPAKGKIWPA